MEAHFVHRAESGALAVVGVLMATGKPNAAFSKIVSTMPMKEGPAVKADPGIDPNALLPARLGYYRYPGSLTTPPCSETVEWLLLTDPIQVAEARCRGFRQALSDERAPGAERQPPLRAAVELSATPSLPGLTRQSLNRGDSCEIDGCAGQARDDEWSSSIHRHRTYVA